MTVVVLNIMVEIDGSESRSSNTHYLNQNQWDMCGL